MMRRLRRFAIALLGVLLLPVTPLGAAASCLVSTGQPPASVAHAVAADEAPVDAAHDHAAHAQPARAPAPDAPRPDHEPAPPHHGGDMSCPTATACANVAAAGATPDLTASGAPVGTGIAPLEASGPASVVRAPEPPPPRVVRA